MYRLCATKLALLIVCIVGLRTFPQNTCLAAKCISSLKRVG